MMDLLIADPVNASWHCQSAPGAVCESSSMSHPPLSQGRLGRVVDFFIALSVEAHCKK